MERDNEIVLQGDKPLPSSKNEVKAPPGQFYKWVNENKDRVDKAKSLAYFLKDNKESMSPL